MTARVVYLMSVSLDGYINSPTGSLDWADVDEELHFWFNDRARETAAFIDGRRLYETMVAFWPTAESVPGLTPAGLDFARIWRDKPRIVFSRTLPHAEAGYRLMRTDIVDELPALKAEFDGELGIGGATLASALIARNLVDEYQVVVHPVILGGGTPFFPPLSAPLDLRLTDTHRFTNGAVALTYVPR